MDSSIKNYYQNQIIELAKNNTKLQKKVGELNYSLRNETIHSEEQRQCIQALKKIIQDKIGGLICRKSGEDNVIFEEDSDQKQYFSRLSGRQLQIIQEHIDQHQQMIDINDQKTQDNYQEDDQIHIQDNLVLKTSSRINTFVDQDKDSECDDNNSNYKEGNLARHSTNYIEHRVEFSSKIKQSFDNDNACRENIINEELAGQFDDNKNGFNKNFDKESIHNGVEINHQKNLYNVGLGYESITDQLRGKLNEWLPGKLSNNYDSRTATVDSLEMLLFDVKNENNKLKQQLREKDGEIEFEKSRGNNLENKLSIKEEFLEKSQKSANNELEGKKREIKNLREMLKISNIDKQNCNKSPQIKECQQCLNAYKDLNELKKEVESINIESSRRREKYDKELNEGLNKLVVKLRNIVENPTTNLSISTDSSSNLLKELDSTQRQDFIDKVYEFLNINGQKDQPMIADPKEQIYKITNLVIYFSYYIETLYMSMHNLANNTKKQDHIETRTDFEEESEKFQLWKKKFLEQEKELACTNNQLKTQILTYEKKLKISDERVNKLTKNYEDAMKQFEIEQLAQSTYFEEEFLANEVISDKMKSLLFIQKNMISDDKSVCQIERHFLLIGKYFNAIKDFSYGKSKRNLDTDETLNENDKENYQKFNAKRVDDIKMEFRDIENELRGANYFNINSMR